MPDIYQKAKIDTDKLKKFLDGRTYKAFWEKCTEFGLDMKYRAFCSNLNNEVEIKLFTAFIICKVLNISIEDLFFMD